MAPYIIQNGSDLSIPYSVRKTAAHAFKVALTLQRLGIKSVIVRTADGETLSLEELAALADKEKRERQSKAQSQTNVKPATPARNSSSRPL
jgi:hypothetical protein